jgi:hypothetical protein
MLCRSFKFIIAIMFHICDLWKTKLHRYDVVAVYGWRRSCSVSGRRWSASCSRDPSWCRTSSRYPSEVFVTSSIKLIVPVNRVLIPPVEGMESTTLWQSDCRGPNDYPFTQLILSGIMQGEYMRGSPSRSDANVGP